MADILIIEDEPGVQMTLEDRLLTEGYKVCIKGDGIRGEDEARRKSYDLILLDLMLPGRDGFLVCQNLRKDNINTPIIMLTARNTDLDVVMGLRQGADDYLVKPFDMGVLLARMEAVLRRAESRKSDSSILPSKIDIGDFTLDIIKGQLLKGSLPVILNAQEYRLLEYLACNPDKVISRDELLDEVWGYDNMSISRTVDVHIAKLRQKLGEGDIPRMIQTIRGRGYKFTKVKGT